MNNIIFKDLINSSLSKAQIKDSRVTGTLKKSWSLSFMKNRNKKNVRNTVSIKDRQKSQTLSLEKIRRPQTDGDV